MKPRSIIHINIADFAARLEVCARPQLQDRPLVIAPAGSPRAVVYDMNEAAFQEGICKGMPLSRIRNRGIAVLPPRFNRYERAMNHIRKLGLALTPAVESGIGDGHLFLDISGTGRLYGPPPDVAFRLKKSIRKELGLDPIWALASNKLVAKAASRMVKPLGEYIVGPGEEARFLDPLPLALLPGMTRQEAETAARFNLETVSQLRQLTPAQLSIPFAERAGTILCMVRGEDREPVRQGLSPGLTADHEFASDTNDTDELKACIAALSQQISRHLHQRGCRARVLEVCISYSDGIQHQARLPRVGQAGLFLFGQAWALFDRAWKRRTRIRHIRLACTTVQPVQADLFASVNPVDKTAGRRLVEKAALEVRQRFGSAALTLAAALHTPPSPAVP